MQKGKWLGLGILAAAMFTGYRIWNTNESIKYFQYSLKGLSFNLKNILQPEIIITLSIYNPNRTSVPVNDLFGVLKLKGLILANFKNTEPLNISGQETKDVVLRTRLSVLSVASSILNKTSFTEMQIEGMIKTGLFDLPISKTFNYKSA